jgi:hypothetical protein
MIPPCPAAWSTVTPCQNPDGDLHDGPCFHIDPDTGAREEWDRNTSWFCEPVRSGEDRRRLRAERYGGPR